MNQDTSHVIADRRASPTSRCPEDDPLVTLHVAISGFSPRLRDSVADADSHLLGQAVSQRTLPSGMG